MKKQSFLLLILFSFISIFSFAQKDPKAEEILNAVSAKYKSYKSVCAAFKLIIDNQIDHTKENQDGIITIKGGKYKLEMKDQDVISDGKTVWTFLKEENEVQINDANAKPDAITPTSIFTIYEKGFRSKYMDEKSEGGKIIQHIELVPEDAKKPYTKIQLSINKEEKYVTSAKVLNKNGINLIYTVEKFTPDAPAADPLFTFDTAKHPDVDVVDLR